jgi:hypothetical protein
MRVLPIRLWSDKGGKLLLAIIHEKGDAPTVVPGRDMINIRLGDRKSHLPVPRSSGATRYLCSSFACTCVEEVVSYPYLCKLVFQSVMCRITDRLADDMPSMWTGLRHICSIDDLTRAVADTQQLGFKVAAVTVVVSPGLFVANNRAPASSRHGLREASSTISPFQRTYHPQGDPRTPRAHEAY